MFTSKKSNMFVRKSTCVLLATVIFITSTFCGCGGQVAHPKDHYMPGDEKKSCSVLYTEIGMLDNEITKKIQSKKDRDFWNTVEFLGGVLVIVPFFFMDSKGSHEIELEALENRQKMLKTFFADKGCSVTDLNVQSSDKSVENESETHSFSEAKLKECFSCKQAIGIHDDAHIYRGKVVCSTCYAKLKDAEKEK